MIALLEVWVALVPLDIPPPSSFSPPSAAQPSKNGNGFAAYIVGGFFALGLILVAGLLVGLKPKRGRPTTRS